MTTSNASVAPVADEDPLVVEITPHASRHGGETVAGGDFLAGVIHDSLDLEGDNTGIQNARDDFSRIKIFQFLAGFKIASFDFRGLFLSRFVDFSIQKHKWDFLEFLKQKHDILLLQECHGSQADMEMLHSRDTSWQWYGSFCSDSGKGGIMVGVGPKLTGTSVSCTYMWESLVRGRIGALSIGVQGYVVNLVNVHLVPGLLAIQFKEQINLIYQFLQIWSGRFNVLMGDFNFVDDHEGRLGIKTGLTIRPDTWHETVFHEKLGFLLEVCQPDYTRRGTELVNGIATTTQLARLDRCFLDINGVELGDMKPISGTIGKCTNCNDISDHVPVFLHLCPPTDRPPVSNRLPQWISEHPLYEHCVSQLIGSSDDFLENLRYKWCPKCNAEEFNTELEECRCNSDHRVDPFDALRFFQRCLTAAWKQFHRILATRTATSREEKLYWATKFFRCSRNGDSAEVSRCIAAYPDLKGCGYTRTSEIIAQLRREIAENILEGEGEEEGEVEECERLARYRKAQNRSTKWALKK